MLMKEKDEEIERLKREIFENSRRTRPSYLPGRVVSRSSSSRLPNDVSSPNTVEVTQCSHHCMYTRVFVVVVVVVCVCVCVRVCVCVCAYSVCVCVSVTVTVSTYICTSAMQVSSVSHCIIFQKSSNSPSAVDELFEQVIPLCV